MRKILAIGLATMLVAIAAPAIAHEESNPNACKKTKQDCKPHGNHFSCQGVRDWFDYRDDSLSKWGLHIAEDPQEIGAYLHAPPHGEPDDQNPSRAGIEMPGVLWLETNGFESLQKNDWECKSIEHETPANQWVEHPDQVIL